MQLRRIFEHDDGAILDDRAGHILFAGSSGTGKTQALIAFAQAKLSDPRWAVVVVDPEGDISPALYEFIANPRNGISHRVVHYLRPASEHVFALPMLHVPDRSPQLCHDKAVRALAIFEQAVNVGAGDYGPRLSKYFYLGRFGLGLTGRSIVDLPDLYGHASELRRIITDAYPYHFLRDAMEAVDLLSDRAALEYKDPLISRLLPIFGNERLRRVYGPQNPVDIARVLAQREVILLDLSGLEHKDSVLVGKSFLSLLLHEALQRPPDTAPRACVMVDECFDYMSVDFARGFDRLRKRNIQLVCAIQRLGQLT